MTTFADRHRAENDRINTLAKTLRNASVEQPIDPDDPPVPCGCGDCKRDAVLIIRLHVGSPREYGMTACRKHASAMRQAAYSAMTS